MTRAGALNYNGIVVVEDLFVGGSFERLLDESLRLLKSASTRRATEDHANETRGGAPTMSLRISPGGTTQGAFYEHPAMLGLLEQMTGQAVTCSGARGCYNYYTRAGDHMGLHRDAVGCEVTVITCLLEEGVTNGGGMLLVYPERTNVPLSVIRTSPDEGALAIRITPRQSLIMYGGRIPHLLTPIDDGQRRVVSALCYATTE